jgi:isopentenyldiphosphate isomerase
MQTRLGKKEKVRIAEFLSDTHYAFDDKYTHEEYETACRVCGRTTDETDALDDTCGEVCSTLWTLYCDNVEDGESECLPWLLAHARRAFSLLETHDCHESLYG